MKNDLTAPAKKKTRRGFDKGAFYRVSRMLHAYVSAFAFLALMFFSVTGLLLNHPTWLQGETPPERSVTLQLPRAEVAAALKETDPTAALARMIDRRLELPGAYKSGEVLDGEAMLRLEGARGATDVIVNLETGLAEGTIQPATATSVVNDLHKGKNTGAVWRLMIDVTAVLVLVLSLIGYVLFFSLRFRLKTSLILTGLSLAVFGAAFMICVP